MRTTHAARVALVCTALWCATASLGQSGTNTSPPSDDALYQSLGGQPGLVTLVDDFMRRLLADARMNPFFKDADQPHVKAQLVAQFCKMSGGPCRLKGPDMKKAHAGFDIDKANFNALVEVLQQAMDAQGIGFGQQNRLLSRLAPMHRDIVNVK